MAGIYDKILDQEQQSEPAMPQSEGVNIYDKILDDERAQAQRAMQPVLDLAVQITPDRASTTQKLVKSTGLPTEIVERNFDVLQKREQVANMQRILADSPILSRQMFDPQFAALAQKDLEPLSAIERVGSFFKSSAGAMAGGLYEASAGVVGIGEAGAEVLGLGTSQLEKVGILRNDLGADLASRLRAYRRGIEGISDGYMPESDGIVSGGWYSGLASLSRNMAFLPMVFMPGGQNAALTGMVGPVLGNEYGKGRDEGLPVGSALTYGMSQAVIEWATERIPVTRLLGDLQAGSSFRRILTRQLAAEIPGEQIATVLQDLNEWAVIDSNKGKTFADYLQERPSAAAQTLIATIVGTGGQTSLMYGIDTVMRRASGRDREAQQAQVFAEKLAELARFSRAATIAQTEPETFQQFVEAAMQEGPVQDVYIDASALMQSGVAEELARVSPSVAEQLAQAQELGTPVRIPVAEFAAKIAPTDMGASLLDFLKTEPNGMSRAEAVQVVEGQVAELEAQLTEEMGRAVERGAERAAVESVRDTIASELDAVSRFRPDVNRAYATLVAEFFGSIGQRTGRSAQELFEQYRLRTVAQNIAGGQQFDQQGRLVTDTPEFRNWFGESRVRDADGKPMVVYHGTTADFSEFRINPDEGGIFFSDNPDIASGYAGFDQSGLFHSPEIGITKPVYLSLRNPLEVNLRGSKLGRKEAIAEAKSRGHDGVILRSYYDAGGVQDQYIAFHPEQIKSVFNRGTFDPNDPNILNQVGAADAEGAGPQMLAVHNLSAENLVFAEGMGGLAVPSIGVITEDAGGVDGFGEITLIGTRDMVDPAREAVFSSDAYTARFAKPEWPKAKVKDADELVAMLRPTAEEFGDRSALDETFDNMTRTPDAGKVVDTWINSPAAIAMFLRENGVEVSPVMRESGSRTPIPVARLQELKPLYDALDMDIGGDVMDSPQWVALAEAYGQIVRQTLGEQGRRESLADTLAQFGYRELQGLESDFLRAGKQEVDTWKTRESLRELVDDRAVEFKAWVEARVMPRFGAPFLKVRGRKVPYTLDNIVEVMTSAKTRGAENTMAYGAGQARAATSVQFDDLEQMRAAARDQIVLPEAYEAARKQTEQLLDQYREGMVEHTKLRNWRGDPDTWEALDGSMRALARYTTSKKRDEAAMRSALRREEFDVGSIPADKIRQAMQAADALLQTPVPYFEAKPQRAVGLQEFAGAVIPAAAPDAVREALQRQGIPFVEYQGENGRGDAVRQFAAELQAGGAQTLFQSRRTGPRGSFSPSQNTMVLMQNADLSTFLHESGHFFLEVMTDTAGQLMQMRPEELTDGERGIVRDVQAIMQWFGLRDLNEWGSLDFEEKRAYHEQFAESFEAYLLEGNAPSIELQPMFQRFRAWMLNIYKSLKDFLATNPDAGKLSDEVRAVFDRMLATDAAIETAEQAQSLMPLFESAQQAGMTEDEFAAYQESGRSATETAKEELGAKGVRDMQWLAGARSRALKRLQKQAKALRDEAEIEARREVMSQPVYRAWQWLTGKMEEKLPSAQVRKSDPNVVDPSVDSLFVAIAKLGGIDRVELETQWGMDASQKVAPPVFGKHVLRRNGGRGIDDMRSQLVQYGYLDANESGPDWNPREFEDKFFDELGGAAVYSSAADFDALMRGDRPGDQVANPQAMPAARLDRAALGDTSLTDEQRETLRTRRMVARDGLHPDIVAELFGFDSGDALVQALAAAQEPDTAIGAMADSIMLERNSELATPAAMERAADAAIQNDVRARMVATELNALNRATGKPSVMTQAAREFARRMIERLKVRNVKPAQYSAAQSRAGKAAERALRSGDVGQAAVEKRNQLVNAHAAREAHRALDEIEAGLRYLAKFDKEGTRKSLDIDYLDQIDSILERFDLRKGQSLRAIDRRTSLAAWIESQAEAGIEPEIPDWLQLEASREHYKNLTVEQFRGLLDSVKQIEHLGRLKQRLLTARDNRALEAVVNEIKASMLEASGGRVMNNEKRNTLGSRASHMARGFMASHRQLHSLVREMDGYRDGGPLWDALIRPMNEAGDREASMRAEAAKRLHELARPLLNDGEKMGGKGRFFPSLGRSLNRGERIAIALNWGNEGNKQRLLDGRQWTEAQIEPVLATLTRAELQFVQGVWNFFESYRPMVAEKERRVTGKEPDWIEPTPFVARPSDGGEPMQMRGGYYPIKYDPNQSGEAESNDEKEAAKQMLRAANTAATTRRSYTKTRAEKVMGRPVLLSFDSIYRGANEVIHDLAWHEWLIDANKLIRRLDAPMREQFGAEKVRAVKSALKDIAVGDRPAETELESWLGHLRNGSTIAGLGWNLRTTLLQFTGFTNSMVRIGTPWLARGIREFYGSPAHMIRKVEEAQAKSEFLRNRMRTMNREINDIQNRLDRGKGDIQIAVESSFFIFIQKAQALVDYPTWYGAYEKAMADPSLMNEDGTIDESKAIAMADQAVISAQSGGQMKDLAQIQRGGPLLKLFTNFYSYFATTLQIVVERTQQTNFRKPHEVMRLAGDYLLLMVIPSAASVLINALLRGAPEDEDEWMRQLIEEQIGFLFGFSPITRELTSAAQAATGFGGQFGYNGPAGLRFFAEMYKLGVQANQGEMDMTLFKAANNTAGILFHYPAGQVNRTVEGAIALIEGDTSNPLAVIAGPPR